jgi:hypothetical protein
VPYPFPSLISDQCGCQAANFGYPNAGPDLFLNQPELIDLANKSVLTIVQIMGAQNVTNRFYKVHPRRNDRFVAPSEVLRTFYPDVDFTDMTFTGHLLKVLEQTSIDRHAMIVAELKSAWIARMRRLIRALSGPVLLLWITPSRTASSHADEWSGPTLIDGEMINQITTQKTGVLKVAIPSSDLNASTDGLVFPEMERVGALRVLPVAAHRAVAGALRPVVENAIKKPAPWRGLVRKS